mgnify:CR=1 FL=1
MYGNHSHISHIDRSSILPLPLYNPVVLEDERFTSVLAHRAMIDGGMKKQDRMKKESVDKISAAIILQSYLDRKK